MKFRYSRHAEEEMVRRGIPRKLADEVLRHAEQTIPERDGRVAYQSRVPFDDGQSFLLRVIVDVNTDPSIVVTVYRTSKIDKYWRQR